MVYIKTSRENPTQRSIKSTIIRVETQWIPDWTGIKSQPKMAKTSFVAIRSTTKTKKMEESASCMSNVIEVTPKGPFFVPMMTVSGLGRLSPLPCATLGVEPPTTRQQRRVGTDAASPSLARPTTDTVAIQIKASIHTAGCWQRGSSTAMACLPA